MSEQTSLVAVEIESGPTLFPQFSPTRFVGIKGVDPGNEFDLNQGVGGGGGGGVTPPSNRKQKKRRKRRMCSEYGLLAVLTVCSSAFSKPVSDFCWSDGILAVDLWQV